MDILEQICAVIDAQGFTVNGTFHPREVAIISDTFKQSVACNTGLIVDIMSEEEKKANRYIANNLLGMSYGFYRLEDKAMITDIGEQMIALMYEKVKTQRKPIVAIKNYQLTEILNRWDIPYISLENYGCPPLAKLWDYYGHDFCHFHERAVPFKQKVRCAEHKAKILWQWIRDYRLFNH